MRRLSNTGGFTLIEALAAITILIVGILGPLTLAARGISDGLFAKNQITANYLAQEALELIINRRDSNVLNFLTAERFAGIDGCFNKDCWVNPLSGDLNEVVGGGSVPLVYCTNLGFYGAPDSCPANNFGPIFNRTIKIDEVREISVPTVDACEDDETPALGDPLEIKVTVTINWLNKLAPRSHTAVEYLYACE